MKKLLLMLFGLLLAGYTLMLTSFSIFSYGLAGLIAGVAICAVVWALAWRT